MLKMYPRSEFVAGIFFILIASFCYSLAALFATFLQARVPLAQVLLIQNIFSLLFIIPSLKAHRLQSPYWKFNVLRGVVGFGGIFAFYSSLKYLNFADAAVLSYVSNLLIPAFSYFFLKEISSKKVWWPIGLAFIGVIILLQPSWSVFQLGSTLALISAVTSATNMTIVRYLNIKGEPQPRIIFYLFLISALLAFPFAIANWVPLNFQDWILLIIIGIVLGVNQLYLTKGLKMCPAPILVPFSYSTILYGVIFDWMIWEKGTKIESILGAIFIMAGGILAYRIQAKKKEAEPTSFSQV